MLNEYVYSLDIGLQKLNLGLTPDVTLLIATLSIYSVVIYTIASIIIFIGRKTHLIKISHTIGDKALTGGCGIFFIYSMIAAYAGRSYIFDFLSIFRPSTITLFLRNPGPAALCIVMLIIAALCLTVLIWMLKACLAVCVSLFRNNLSLNGPLKGILLSVYELFSGFIWLSIILCVFSIGIAIIIFPFIMIIAASSVFSPTRYYVIDSDGNYHYYYY